MNFNCHRTRYWIASLLGSVMLFSQALAVAQACIEPDARPAMAFEQSDCHAPKNPNHCLQQCTASDQNSASAQVVVFPLPATAVLELPPPVTVQRPSYPQDIGLLVAIRPPPSILYCSYLL
jgi:hypothetical protein